jgi:flagellar protein FliT
MAATDSMHAPLQAMPAREELIRCYRELASTMSLMAALTRAKDWTRLPELEARSTVLVERLKAVGTVPLAAEDLAHVRALMARIDADKVEVCSLVKPQLEMLMAKMAQLHKRSDLDRAYGLPH